MLRLFLAIVIVGLVLWGEVVNAQAPSPPPPEAALKALGQMVQDAQGREAQALVRAYTAENRAEAAEKRVKELEPKPHE